MLNQPEERNDPKFVRICLSWMDEFSLKPAFGKIHWNSTTKCNASRSPVILIIRSIGNMQMQTIIRRICKRTRILSQTQVGDRDRGTSGNGLFRLPLDVDDGLVAFEAQGSHGLVLVF